MVRRQVDRWADTDRKRKFSATKTTIKVEAVKHTWSVLLKPRYGFTKQLEASVAPSDCSEPPRSDFGDFGEPGVDERDGKVWIAGAVIQTEQTVTTAATAPLCATMNSLSYTEDVFRGGATSCPPQWAGWQTDARLPIERL